MASAGKINTASAWLAAAVICAALPLAAQSPEPYRRPIVVVFDDNYPPHSFRAADGSVNGIVEDLWKLWSVKTGREVVLKPMDWSEALKTMERGDADVIDTIFRNPERDKLYDFTPPWATIGISIYHDLHMKKTADLSSVSGLVIGGKAGDSSMDMVASLGEFKMKAYPNYESLIRAADAEEIHAFVMDDPPARYFLSIYGLTDRFKSSIPIPGGGQFHRAVRKGDSATLALVEAGFSAISSKEAASISARWFSARGQNRELLRGFGLAAIAAAAVILVLVGLSVFFRSQVAQKTQLLRQSLDGLEESEAHTKALLEATPDMIFIIDAEGRFKDYKPSAEFGTIVPPERFMGKLVREVLPPAVAELTHSMIPVVRSGKGPVTFDYDLEYQGRMHTYEARMRPYDSADLIIIIRDITQRRAEEQEAIRGQKLESLGIFAGGIAHDFNNILTAIIGSLSIVRARPDVPEQAAALLEQAEKAAFRAAALTSQLLAFAKGGEPVRKPADLAAIARETATFALSGSPCALSFSAEDGPFMAEVDKGQFSQVIHNLVLNASQAMPAGGTISVRLSRTDGSIETEPAFIRIEIEDSGCGIPAENLGRIFDPYFTTKKDGNGLGLSICHTIVKRHDGSIKVSSEPGVGSTFTILLPAMAGTVQPEARRDGNAAPAPGKGARVLVMDDEEPIRAISAAILDSMGLPWALAPEGSQAMELFLAEEKAGRPFDLVIADLTVPGGMGGRELVEKLRAAGKPFRALVISGYSNDPVLSSFRDYGFDGCLAKPFRAEDFKRAVRDILDAV